LAALLLLSPEPAVSGEPVRLLVLGDSLAAGLGLALAEAFPARLERALRAEGLDVRVIDGGVSGDTTAGGRARLDWLLAGGRGGPPDAAIVELGANDALRGLDPEATFANLDAIVGELRRRGVRVLLAGMKAPPNMGRGYLAAFDAVYPRLAEKHGVPLYPFFLDGVAAVPALNQLDRVHPNADGVAEIVRRILPDVRRLLR
jgi:acyl-CoA thioesterase-1